MGRKRLNINVENIIKLYKEGKSSIEIAEIYKCSDSSIRNKLKENNITRRSNGAWLTIQAGIDESKIRKIKDLYLSGMSSRKIASEINLHSGTVYQIVKKLEINRDKWEAGAIRRDIKNQRKEIVKFIKMLTWYEKPKKKIDQSGIKNSFYGKRHSFDTRRKISAYHRGISIEQWDGFTNPRASNEHTSNEIKRWRIGVFRRDKHKCQLCGCRGGSIEAHHIKTWAKYPGLRYDINNGITLCRKCHDSIMKREDDWVDYFSSIIIKSSSGNGLSVAEDQGDEIWR